VREAFEIVGFDVAAGDAMIFSAWILREPLGLKKRLGGSTVAQRSIVGSLNS